MNYKEKVEKYELFQQMIDDGENPNLNEVWNAAIEAAVQTLMSCDKNIKLQWLLKSEG